MVPGYVARPMNAFMLFSKDRRPQIGEETKLHNAKISKVLSTEWKELAPHKKNPYIEDAEFLRELHKFVYPDYKYQPKRGKKTAKQCKDAEEVQRRMQQPIQQPGPAFFHGQGWPQAYHHHLPWQQQQQAQVTAASAFNAATAFNQAVVEQQAAASIAASEILQRAWSEASGTQGGDVDAAALRNPFGAVTTLDVHAGGNLKMERVSPSKQVAPGLGSGYGAVGQLMQAGQITPPGQINLPGQVGSSGQFMQPSTSPGQTSYSGQATSTDRGLGERLKTEWSYPQTTQAHSGMKTFVDNQQASPNHQQQQHVLDAQQLLQLHRIMDIHHVLDQQQVLEQQRRLEHPQMEEEKMMLQRMQQQQHMQQQLQHFAHQANSQLVRIVPNAHQSSAVRNLSSTGKESSTEIDVVSDSPPHVKWNQMT